MFQTLALEYDFFHLGGACFFVFEVIYNSKSPNISKAKISSLVVCLNG